MLSYRLRIGDVAKANVPSGWAITFDGGRHVMAGRGVACIDTPVYDFLAHHKDPTVAVTECTGKFLADSPSDTEYVRTPRHRRRHHR